LRHEDNFQNARCQPYASRLQPRQVPRRGYPVSARKKMRACVVTYRHSGEQQFEKC
jgi:hypothetical protein